MWYSKFIVLCCLLTPSLTIWQCRSDEECTSLSGSACTSGVCACPSSQQIVAGGTLCANYAPYFTSNCVDDFQCSRLFTAFHCRRSEDQAEGNCFCQPGHHYFLGRCWRSVAHGEACTRDEECMGIIRDPFSMVCEETCRCSDGYYNRQRGECRKIASAVGERCVLDEDCHFENSACDARVLVCFDTTVVRESYVEDHDVAETRNVRTHNATLKMAESKMARQDGAACSATSPCPSPFECSSWGHCVCPLGYYESEDGSTCFAELGSPATTAQCVGLLTVVQDGICTCPANFFYNENMRDCVKVARLITDFCSSDEQCHTFGASASCGALGQWGLRTCQCDEEVSVWDARRGMCRLFAGIGEACDVDSDCMAGDFEIQCVVNEEGRGYCACPEGLVASEGLCLSSGLVLGDSCQMTQECSGTPNTVCEGGRCACDNGYQELEDICAPIIGGTCIADTDCVINNTVCVEGDTGMTCQCVEEHVEYSDECWEISSGYNSSCTVDAQCWDALGPSGACLDGFCLCGRTFHYKDSACWPMTGLFEACTRSSQCYLGERTDTVVCRNGLCQCDFNYPYSEELRTCTSSATIVTSSSFIVITIFAYLFL